MGVTTTTTVTTEDKTTEETTTRVSSTTVTTTKPDGTTSTTDKTTTESLSTTAPTISTTTTDIPESCLIWDDWRNLNIVSTGDDRESIEQYLEQSVCETVEAIECRSTQTKLSVEDAGEGAICNIETGLYCNSANLPMQFGLGFGIIPMCQDYEIRIQCIDVTREECYKATTSTAVPTTTVSSVVTTTTAKTPSSSTTAVTGETPKTTQQTTSLTPVPHSPEKMAKVYNFLQQNTKLEESEKGLYFSSLDQKSAHNLVQTTEKSRYLLNFISPLFSYHTSP